MKKRWPSQARWVMSSIEAKVQRKKESAHRLYYRWLLASRRLRADGSTDLCTFSGTGFPGIPIIITIFKPEKPKFRISIQKIRRELRSSG